MKEYHKIHTIFKRDMANKGKIIETSYSKPEFELLKDVNWEITEKIDGTNIRIMFDGVTVKIGGKTNNAQIHTQLYEKLTQLFPVEKMIGSFPGCTEVCLYGEGFGPGIQKDGGNYGKEKDFILFDALIGKFWLDRVNLEDVAKKLEIKIVPLIGIGPLPLYIELIKSKSFHSTFGSFEPEGFVAKPTIGLFNKHGERVITKLKYADFK